MIAADDRFRAHLGLTAGDATSLLSRAESDGALHALVSGEGPDFVRVPGPAGAVDVVRSRCAEGMFLHARAAGGDAPGSLEHTMHSLALSRIAGGIAHDVKNPLNAMALQIALLTDKIAGSGEPLASGCANNLASLRNQIARVNDVVRRLADVADPPAASAFDLGELAADVTNLFGHEGRRRHVALSCEAVPGLVVARGDASRAARVLLGITWRGLTQAGGGRLAMRAVNRGSDAVVEVEHGLAVDPTLAWVPQAAAEVAREMSGGLLQERTNDAERLELRLRRESAR